MTAQSSRAAVERDAGVRGARSLWLPLREPRAAWAAAGALLLYYTATMCRDLSLYDSPELALAAEQLGLGHPLGQPLHTLLGWAFMQAPWVAPLVGLNWLSSLPAALSVVPMTSLAERLDPGGRRPWATAALVAVFGLHFALWEPATRIEVYALSALFALWTVARIAWLLEQGAGGANAWFGCGLALGLAACANAYSATGVALAVAPRLLHLSLRRQLPWRAIGAAVAGGIVGLLPYAYVPSVAGRLDAFVWGAPTDLASLRHYFLGLDFQRDRELTGPVFLDHWQVWLLWSWQRAVLPLLLLGAVAHVWLSRRRALGGSFLWLSAGLVISLLASNTVFHPDNPDYLGYLSVPLWCAAAGVAALLTWLARHARTWLVAVLSLVLLGIVVSAPPAVWARTRHLDRFTREIARGALEHAPTGAILIVRSDHWAGPLLYLNLAEDVRRDVVVLVYGLASSSWYWEQLYRRHPGLARFELRGPGGRFARVQRFVQANRQRPLRVQTYRLAARFGRSLCPAGWLLAVGEQCARRAPARTPPRVLANTARTLGSGSPWTLSAVAASAFDLGDAWWRLGHPRAAFEAFVSGVPPGALPQDDRDYAAEVGWHEVAALGRMWPAWRHHVPIGDPARNLYAAAYLLRAAGHRQGALVYLRAAAAAGLPEAQHALRKGGRDT